MKSAFSLVHLLPAVMIFTLISCKKKEDITPAVVDFSYFPFKTNWSLVYQAEEITIDVSSHANDTLRYFLKEYYESSFVDNEGNPSVRIERFTRNADTLPWEIKDVCYVSKIGNSVHKVENNIRFVKIIFPAKLEKTWNGNAYNTDEPQEYLISRMDLPETINLQVFDSVLTVEQENDVTLIYKKYKVEKYAKNTGLIYKQMMDVDSQTINNLPIEQRITKGTIYTQQLIMAYSN